MIKFALESYAVVPGEAVVEAVAMYTRGWVVCPNKTHFEIRSSAAEYRVTTLSDTQFTVEAYPKEECAAGFKTEMLCLWLGLHRTGIRIDCDDQFIIDFPKSAIPSLAKLHKTVMFRRVFMDDHHHYFSCWQIANKMLRVIHQMFARTPNLSELSELAVEEPRVVSAHTVINYHHYQIEIQAVDGIIRAHRLVDFTPDDPILSDGLMTEIQQRRSWGEVWIPHMSNMTKVSGVMAMDDQAFVITDRIERYRVEDAGSLRRRHLLPMGTGQSQVYSLQDWLRMADQLTQIGQLPTARKCLAQAKLKCVTKEEQQTVKRLQDSVKKIKAVDVRYSPDYVRHPFKEVRAHVSNEVWQRLLDIEIDRARIGSTWLEGYYVAQIKGVRAGIADVPRAVAAGLCSQAVTHMQGMIITSLDSEPLEHLYSTEVDGRLIVFGINSGLYFVEGFPNCVFDVYSDRRVSEFKVP